MHVDTFLVRTDRWALAVRLLKFIFFLSRSTHLARGRMYVINSGQWNTDREI